MYLKVFFYREKDELFKKYCWFSWLIVWLKNKYKIVFILLFILSYVVNVLKVVI